MKWLKCVLLMLVLSLLSSIATIYAVAQESFLIRETSGLSIKNSEGEQITLPDPYFIYDDDEEIIATMKDYNIEQYFDEEGNDTALEKISIPKSSSYTFSRADGKTFEEYFMEKVVGEHTQYVNLRVADHVVMTDDSITVYPEQGSYLKYWFGGYMPKTNRTYNVGGNVFSSVISLKETAKGLTLKGVSGKTNISITENWDNIKMVDGEYSIWSAEDNFYIFDKNKPVKVWIQGKQVKAEPAIRLSSKKTKKFTNLYLRPANNGKNMFLTWNRVKKAKSYIVYIYDVEKDGFRKYETKYSNSSNFCSIPKVDSFEKFRMKVVAKSGEDGNGKTIAKSYEVSAAAKNNLKWNVKSVKPKKSKVTLKRGKTRTVRMELKAGGKPFFSSRLRWYTSNRKVAIVGLNTGKIKGVKKGTCYVWAKAHNGKNSKKIKVVVK